MLLPHWANVALLSPGARTWLDPVDLAFDDAFSSGEGAEGYDHALELRADSGNFTVAIARRPPLLAAVEPWPTRARSSTSGVAICGAARRDDAGRNGLRRVRRARAGRVGTHGAVITPWRSEARWG